MADFDNTNSGALFVNDKKQNERSPHFRGSAEPVCPHCGCKTKFWISAWKKAMRTGGNFLSLAFTADDTEQVKKENQKPAENFDFDDDIPF